MREKREGDEIKVMMCKFDKDMKLHFQEQKLKAAQQLHEEEEKRLEELVKQLAAEHRVTEEDIRVQVLTAQDIVKDEVEKKMEKERKEEEEKRKREQMVHERAQEEWEENWAQEEQSVLEAIYNREREIEMQIGVEDADAMAWEYKLE